MAIGRAERGTRRGAQHERVGQRVAQQTLEGGPGEGQPGPDDHRGEHPRQAQLPDDRLGGRRPGRARVDAEGPRQDDAERLGRADADGPQSDPGDEQDDEGDDRPDRRRGATTGPATGGHGRWRGGRWKRPALPSSGRSYGAEGSGMSGTDRRGQVAQPDGQARTGSGDLGVLDGHDRALLDGGHDVPPGTRRDLLRGRHVERIDAEDDLLRIRIDERLERDLVAGRIAGRDDVTAGQRHHLGHERAVGRGEDLPGRVGVADLVEGPRVLALGHGRGDGVHLGPHRRDQLVRPRRSVPVASPMQVDVVVHALDRGGVDHEHRDAEVAQPGDGVGGREAQATGQDEVRARHRRWPRRRRRRRWRRRAGAAASVGVVAPVVGRDDAVTGAEGEQDLGRRRGQRHDPLRSAGDDDGRALVVGQVGREGSRGRARGGDARLHRRWARSTCAAEPQAARSQATTMGRATRRRRRSKLMQGSPGGGRRGRRERHTPRVG